MGNELRRDLTKQALAEREAKNFAAAGKSYTLAAYAWFGTDGFDHIEIASGALVSLLKAALCYRLSGDIERASNRSKQGQLIAEEFKNYGVERDVQRGVCDEYGGDFLAVVGNEQAKEYYESAASTYETYEQSTTIDERIGQLSEEEFHRNTIFLREVLAAADWSLEEEQRKTIEFHSPTARVEFKRSYLSSVIEDIVASGTWSQHSEQSG